MEITMETTTSVQAPQKTSIASAVPLISRVLMPSDSADSSTSMLYKHRETGGCKPLTFYYTVPHAVCHPAHMAGSPGVSLVLLPVSLHNQTQQLVRQAWPCLWQELAPMTCTERVPGCTLMTCVRDCLKNCVHAGQSWWRALQHSSASSTAAL